MFDKKKFIEKYQGKILQDDGSVVSAEFKKFFSDFRRAYKAEFKKYGITLTVLNKGHYDLSGFVTRDGKCVYFSYNYRRGLPLDMFADGVMTGALYRTAANLNDFRGGHNNFCRLAELASKCDQLLGRG